MEKLTIILNDHGLRYASALVSTGVQLDLFLLADGVAAARPRTEDTDRLLQRGRHA